MASRGRGNNEGVGVGVVAKVLNSSSIVQYDKETACSTTSILWKVCKSTGKAAWYTGTTTLILIVLVPLSIVMDREQQLIN